MAVAVAETDEAPVGLLPSEVVVALWWHSGQTGMVMVVVRVPSPQAVHSTTVLVKPSGGVSVGRWHLCGSSQWWVTV